MATFILYNSMIKSYFPTYDLREGAGMLLWHHGIVNKDMGIDSVRDGRTGNVLVDYLLNLIPTDIKLQDRAADILGWLAGTSVTIGNMQVRSGPVENFPEERNVKTHDLLKRLEIDTSGLSNTQINWMLLTNPRLDIEAGVAALRQELDKQIEFQHQGRRANTPLAPNFEELKDNWIYPKYDNYAARQFGPDLLLWLIISDFPFSPTIQDFTNNLLTDDLRNADFPLFHIIALESGVFDEIPGIIVGVTTPEKVEYLYEIARGTDTYLQDAAIRSLKELINDTDPKISEKAKYFLNKLNSAWPERYNQAKLWPMTLLAAVTSVISTQHPISRRAFLAGRWGEEKVDNLQTEDTDTPAAGVMGTGIIGIAGFILGAAAVIWGIFSGRIDLVAIGGYVVLAGVLNMNLGRKGVKYLGLSGWLARAAAKNKEWYNFQWNPAIYNELSSAEKLILTFHEALHFLSHNPLIHILIYPLQLLFSPIMALVTTVYYAFPRIKIAGLQDLTTLNDFVSVSAFLLGICYYAINNIPMAATMAIIALLFQMIKSFSPNKLSFATAGIGILITPTAEKTLSNVSFQKTSSSGRLQKAASAVTYLRTSPKAILRRLTGTQPRVQMGHTGGTDGYWQGRSFIQRDPNDPRFSLVEKYGSEEDIRDEARIMFEFQQAGFPDIPKLIANDQGEYVSRNGEGDDGVLCYRTDNARLRYLNDLNEYPAGNSKEINKAKLRKATVANMKELGWLFSHGYIHTSLVALSHHYYSGYWSWDYDEDFETTGIISYLEPGLQFPNLRIGGLADFEHVKPFGIEDIEHHLGQNLIEMIILVGYTGVQIGLSDEEIMSILHDGINTFSSSFSTLEILDEFQSVLVSFISCLRKRMENGLMKDTTLYLNDLKPLLFAVRSLIIRYKQTDFFQKYVPALFKYYAFTQGEGAQMNKDGVALWQEMIVEPKERRFPDRNYIEGYDVLTKEPRFKYTWGDGIAFTQERIFIINRYNKTVQILDKNGKNIGSLNRRFSNPSGITIISNRVYVSDIDNNKIFVFDLDGNSLFSFGQYGTREGELNDPKHLLAYNNQLIVIDSRNNRLQVFDQNGKFLNIWGENGELEFPVGGMVLRGKLLILDKNTTRIQVFAENGTLCASIPSNNMIELEPGIFVRYIDHRPAARYVQVIRPAEYSLASESGADFSNKLAKGEPGKEGKNLIAMPKDPKIGSIKLENVLYMVESAI
ncbi:MAG: hypothetical protein ABH952_02160 [Candidatus Omnitrophota bacterium]